MCNTEYADDISFCVHDGTITVEVQDPQDIDPRLGNQLGQYIVAARVADGAMGRVYEGRHPETKQRVAIKVLHPDVATDHVAVERFKREFETAEELEHENIVKVLEFGQTEDGSYFMTMEYLQGEELSRLIAREGAQPAARLVRILAQAATALAEAHSFGVIHRDLKPDNLFLCESEDGDVVKILDFGSVKLQMETGPKLTAFGTTLGSPYYMSPEQAMGKLDVDQRTDVFAMAAIAYEIATGKVAFEGQNIAEILMKIVHEEPVPVSSVNAAYPPSFDAVIAKGIRKDKLQRFGGTKELAAATLEALGLDADPVRWAKTSSTEIESAVAHATPALARPNSIVPSSAGSSGASAGRKAQPSSSSSSTGPRGHSGARDSSKPPRTGMGTGVVLGLGVGALFLVGMAAAYWLLG